MKTITIVNHFFFSFWTFFVDGLCEFILNGGGSCCL